jgi:hypothetical protein
MSFVYGPWNGWLSPILSSFSLRFRDDKSSVVTFPSIKPLEKEKLSMTVPGGQESHRSRCFEKEEAFVVR